MTDPEQQPPALSLVDTPGQRNARLAPLPPAPIVYVVLEFACAVHGAADEDATYADAVKQLRTRLDAEEQSLPMRFLDMPTYQALLADNAFCGEVYDWPLADAFSWPFGRDNFPASPEALIDEIAKAEALMHVELPNETPFDAHRLAALSGISAFDARFTHWGVGETIKRIGDGSHDMTFAEIVWLLHQSTLNDNLGDHFFFEALYPDQTVQGRAVPLFDVLMGS